MPDGLVIASRRVVVGGKVVPTIIAIEGERIARVDPWDGQSALPGGTVDAGDLAILPGLVDTHVHINEPGRTDWEGFDTGTASAAAGGITTIVVMPLNCTPAGTTRDALLAEAAAAEGRCACDYGFWGGAVPGNADQIEPMLDAGALGMKCFLVPSGVDDFPAIGEHDLRPAMRILAQRAAPLLVHAEDPASIASRSSTLAVDPRAYLSYIRSRPVKAETSAIAMMYMLCRQTGCRTHIVHVSSWRGAELVHDARRAELPFSGETCPHYLTFAAEEIGDGLTIFKCAPPIREREERDGLWAALNDGALQMVVSDHSPCPPALKHAGDGNLAAAWGGIASLELGLSAVWTGASARGAGLAGLTRWMCEEPARLAGLQDRKGKIATGYDADLILLDPDREFVVDPAQLNQRHKITPYAGRSLRGVVHRTLLRGQVAFEAGQPLSQRRGRWIKRDSH